MASKRKNTAIRGVLAFIITMLVLSGTLRLGAVGFAVASNAPDPAPPLNEDTCVTDTETQELMALLKSREERIKDVEKTQADRQAKLAQAEAAILDNLARVEEAEARLSKTIQNVDGASSEDIDQLTAVYQSMKPKDAAQLFEQMTPDFASGFLGKMSPAAAAGILSGLSSEKAYAISVVLAGRNANAPKQ